MKKRIYAIITLIFCLALFSCKADISPEQRKILAKEIAELVLKGINDREAENEAQEEAFMDKFYGQDPDYWKRAGEKTRDIKSTLWKHTSEGQKNTETKKPDGKEQ